MAWPEVTPILAEQHRHRLEADAHRIRLVRQVTTERRGRWWRRRPVLFRVRRVERPGKVQIRDATG